MTWWNVWYLLSRCCLFKLPISKNTDLFKLSIWFDFVHFKSFYHITKLSTTVKWCCGCPLLYCWWCPTELSKTIKRMIYKAHLKLALVLHFIKLRDFCLFSSEFWLYLSDNFIKLRSVAFLTKENFGFYTFRFWFVCTPVPLFIWCHFRLWVDKLSV